MLNEPYLASLSFSLKKSYLYYYMAVYIAFFPSSLWSNQEYYTTTFSYDDLFRCFHQHPYFFFLFFFEEVVIAKKGFTSQPFYSILK